MEKTYIFGHKNPDTDSVTAAISLSYLKNKLNDNTIPAVLGEINKETKFVLEQFNTKLPTLLNDVKLQIKDIRYKKDIYINEKDSINEAFNYMNKMNFTMIPVVNDEKNLVGIVSM